MERLTSNNYHEMGMHQLALNQAYIGDDGWAWYVKGPDEECSVCDLIRNAAEALNVELPILGDEDLTDLLTDWLQCGEEEPEGVLATLYRALWAMAELRARLAAYEDTGLGPEEIMALVTPPPNAPLTLEELREMDGEPVWIASQDWRNESCWMLVDVEYELCREAHGGMAVFESYGKTWRAYRRKPEEGTMKNA